VPGGIIRYKEPAADRIRACAREELGADVSSDPAPLLVSENICDQDIRGHHISLLFRCRLLSAPDAARRAASDPPTSGQWRWHDRCPPDLIEAQRLFAPFF
jgi:colanic acid biosynthesis protein WcaH